MVCNGATKRPSEEGILSGERALLHVNGSLLPVKSQLQSSFCLSHIPLVVLQISTGGLIETFTWSSSLCLANRGFALSLA